MTSEDEGGPDQWFSLELAYPQKISRVQIAIRTDYLDDRIRNIRITVGSSKEYDPDEPLCLPEIGELVMLAGLQDYSCAGALHEGKYVKISRVGRMNLCEVKVFTASGN